MKTFFNNIKIIYRPEGIVIPYILKGPRGADYMLVRNIHDHLLYSDKKIKGYDCFTDKNGSLEPVRRY